MSPFYRQQNRGKESLHNLLKDAQWVRGRVRLIQAACTPSHHTFLPLSCHEHCLQGSGSWMGQGGRWGDEVQEAEDCWVSVRTPTDTCHVHAGACMSPTQTCMYAWVPTHTRAPPKCIFIITFTHTQAHAYISISSPSINESTLCVYVPRMCVLTQTHINAAVYTNTCVWSVCTTTLLTKSILPFPHLQAKCQP